MKLLLTSSGITNASIANALFALVGKKSQETTIAFIPTASNVEMGDKEWLIDDLVRLQQLKPKAISIVDISAVEENIWRPQLEAADVLFFEGGNTYHLMHWIRQSGLFDVLPGLLQRRVYVGVSAGSMVACKDLQLSASQMVYEEDFDQTENLPALHYVDFYVLPHLNSKYFPKVTREHIEKSIRGLNEKVYAIDDYSAVAAVDGKVRVVSEGEYLTFN